MINFFYCYKQFKKLSRSLMNTSIPKTSSKEKQKNKPKIGAGSKDEKRKQKKEKLAEILQKKKEAQQQAQQPQQQNFVEPVTFGKEFYESLQEISATDVSNMVRKPSKREKTLNAISSLKQIYGNSNFTNPNAVFGEVDNILLNKTINLQQQQAFEEQKKIEQQIQEKQKNKH